MTLLDQNTSSRQPPMGAVAVFRLCLPRCLGRSCMRTSQWSVWAGQWRASSVLICGGLVRTTSVPARAAWAPASEFRMTSGVCFPSASPPAISLTHPSFPEPERGKETTCSAVVRNLVFFPSWPAPVFLFTVWKQLLHMPHVFPPGFVWFLLLLFRCTQWESQGSADCIRPGIETSPGQF